MVAICIRYNQSCWLLNFDSILSWLIYGNCGLWFDPAQFTGDDKPRCYHDRLMNSKACLNAGVDNRGAGVSADGFWTLAQGGPIRHASGCTPPLGHAIAVVMARLESLVSRKRRRVGGGALVFFVLNSQHVWRLDSRDSPCDCWVLFLNVYTHQKIQRNKKHQRTKPPARKSTSTQNPCTKKRETTAPAKATVQQNTSTQKRKHNKTTKSKQGHEQTRTQRSIKSQNNKNTKQLADKVTDWYKCSKAVRPTLNEGDSDHENVTNNHLKIGYFEGWI